jgi:tRNA-Thr(GGU) m(6)t(6)A37 methyltransferase TsaA
MRAMFSILLLAAALLSACAHHHHDEAPDEDGGVARFKMTPIGTVSNPKGGPCELRIEPRYRDGLLGLDGWSHVQVFYWFDKNDTPQRRAVLQVNPRGDERNPRTGVFACRAPVRPNLIALSTCKIVRVKDGVVTVDAIDAFDGTPILDLKPYAPGPDRARGPLRMPDWVHRRRGPGASPPAAP